MFYYTLLKYLDITKVTEKEQTVLDKFNKKWKKTQQQYLQRKAHNIGRRHNDFNTAYYYSKSIIATNITCITKYKPSFTYKKLYFSLPYLENSNLNISGQKWHISAEQIFFSEKPLA